MRNGQLPRDVIGEPILLHAGIKIDADGLWLPIRESQFLGGAAEGWINPQGDRGRQGTRISQGQCLINRHRGNTFFPQIFEVEAWVVEAQAGGYEFAGDVGIKWNLWLPIATNSCLTLPILKNFSDIERVGSKLNFIAHFRVEDHAVRYNLKDKFDLFVIFGLRAH